VPAVLELNRELIGGIALALFWLHSLLIAAAALREFGLLGRLGVDRSQAGVVRSGRGEGGRLAAHVVEQIGRSKGDGVVHFNDSGRRSELFGGVIALADGTEITLAPGAEVAVWPTRAAQAAAAAPASPEAVTEAASQARRGRGCTRTVTVGLAEGDRVFVIPAGEGPGPHAPIVLSAVDPRAWLTSKRALILAFVVGEITLAGACTVLALWPPLFDTISMIGAAAALGLFLAVQPVGVDVQDRVRTPDRAYLRGRWG
jgi:hypothetical protein